MKYAGLIYDDSRHYVDHLGPFCALMQWPLIVCENSVAQLARRFYPNLSVIEKDFWDLEIPENVVTCDTLPILKAAFPHARDIRTFWLPHGNSDKGWKSPFFEALAQEKTALVYGQKMVDFISEKKVSPQLLKIGNFRWDYFLKNRSFYSDLVFKEIGLIQRKGNLLYAPTWEDSEDNGSFWKCFPLLAKALPDEYNLIVKIHPNTQRLFEVELEVLMGRFERKKNITFLTEFPPVYPLLNICDAYLGDMSSIGYDFLKFNKPMFFLNPSKRNPLTDPGLYLYRCGIEISPQNFESIFERLYENDSFSEIRRKTESYTFDPVPDWEEFKQRVFQL